MTAARTRSPVGSTGSSVWTVRDRWPFPVPEGPEDRSRRKAILIVAGSALVLAILFGVVAIGMPGLIEKDAPASRAIEASPARTEPETPDQRPTAQPNRAKEPTFSLPPLEPLTGPRGASLILSPDLQPGLSPAPVQTRALPGANRR